MEDRKIKAFIFDLDGTLVDTMPAHFQAWRDVLAPYEVILDRDFYYGMAGWPSAEVAKAIINRCGLDIDPQVASKHKEALFMAHIGEMKIIPETVALAREYFGRLPMAVATGSRSRQAGMLLDQLQLKELFPVVLTADDDVRPKPAPDIFLKAAELMGVRPQNCVVFEDGDPGLAGADSAGMFKIDVRKPRKEWDAVLRFI